MTDGVSTTTRNEAAERLHARIRRGAEYPEQRAEMRVMLDAALATERRLTVEQISGELEHYDRSSDPGYVKVPTERIRAIFRFLLDELGEQRP